MADRIEELRRRVQSDPASIAFAAHAEEYRRAGKHAEAIATCEAGLRRHPAYLSARVTLGRALIEVGRYEEARAALEQVLKMAPENLAAIRGLTEIDQRLGQTGSAPPQARPSQEPAPAARVFEPAAAIPLKRAQPVPASEPPAWEAPGAQEPVQPISGDPEFPAPLVIESTPAPAPAPIPVASSMATRIGAVPAAQPAETPAPAADPALSGLEEFLAAIQRARDALDGNQRGPRS